MREWTEKHIREVIRDELKRLMKKGAQYARMDRTSYQRIDR